MGMDSVELVMAWEEEFDVSIPDAVAATLVTPADAVRIVEGLLEERGAPMERPLIEAKVRDMTIYQLGIRPKEYRLDARFVDDLGVD